jgi:hypothetical protein
MSKMTPKSRQLGKDPKEVKRKLSDRLDLKRLFEIIEKEFSADEEAANPASIPYTPSLRISPLTSQDTHMQPARAFRLTVVRRDSLPLGDQTPLLADSPDSSAKFVRLNRYTKPAADLSRSSFTGGEAMRPLLTGAYFSARKESSPIGSASPVSPSKSPRPMADLRESGKPPVEYETPLPPSALFLCLSHLFQKLSPPRAELKLDLQDSEQETEEKETENRGKKEKREKKERRKKEAARESDDSDGPSPSCHITAAVFFSSFFSVAKASFSRSGLGADDRTSQSTVVLGRASGDEL